MRTVLFFIVFAGIVSVLNFSGCSGSKEKVTIVPLVGTEWKLETLNGKAIKLNGGNLITLNFSASTDKVSGDGVCNTYFSEYVKSANSIKFTGIGSTKRMCYDNLDENDYFNALGSIDSYRVSDGKLTLISKGSAVAVYKP